MDYYETLGVDRTADQNAIKKAYKRLAMKHHPDREDGDEAKFKKIQEAYDTLSDETKRAQYDNPQPHIHEFEFRGGTMEDMVKEAFQNAFRQRQRQNPNESYSVLVDANAAYFGTELDLGIGDKTVKLKIPPGTRSGTRFRMHGEAQKHYDDLPAGDILIRTDVHAPPGVQIVNNDIYVKQSVQCLLAVTGGEVKVDHISGKTLSVKVPEGSQHGSQLRLSHQGMPDPRNPKMFGDMYVVIDLVVPRLSDKEHVEMLNTINEQLKGD